MTKVREYVRAHHACDTVVICAQLESDLTDLSPDEARQYLAELGVQESGVAALIRSTYQLLGLRTFFTFNEKEVRAWTIHAGDTAARAAGTIHTDFERGFIKAERVHYEDLVKAGSVGARPRNRPLLARRPRLRRQRRRRAAVQVQRVAGRAFGFGHFDRRPSASVLPPRPSDVRGAPSGRRPRPRAPGDASSSARESRPNDPATPNNRRSTHTRDPARRRGLHLRRRRLLFHDNRFARRRSGPFADHHPALDAARGDNRTHCQNQPSNRISLHIAFRHFNSLMY